MENKNIKIVAIDMSYRCPVCINTSDEWHHHSKHGECSVCFSCSDFLCKKCDCFVEEWIENPNIEEGILCEDCIEDMEDEQNEERV
tara:strand:+ start:2289 stop:2546 length:258 start_codon:yes stop_codon:yes gene_type:complete